ncbi:SIS domain-containing protein [Violaceomyces palustris]|uniref:SIS domain-containing protein n=1 Tax=Violaceomyces palustris TaxID=1673888 RepID=A0ACD0NT92_9BASI|nr:SIS domain-containing protein [Violaceomyces palustris]
MASYFDRASEASPISRSPSHNPSNQNSPTASSSLTPSSYCSTAVSSLSLNYDAASISPSTSTRTSVSESARESPLPPPYQATSLVIPVLAEKSDLQVEVASGDGFQVEEAGEEVSSSTDEELKKQQEADELESALLFGTQIIQREARALSLAAKRMSKLGFQGDNFKEAVRLILKATNGERGGKVVMTGVGKSGIIARKLSATFLSLGTPSMFLHPTEALHGDLGLLTPHRDVIIALSHSGASPELLSLVPHCSARRCPIIALTGRKDSPLVRAADAWVDCGTGKDEDLEMYESEEDGSESDNDAESERKCSSCGNSKPPSRKASISQKSVPKISQIEPRPLTDEAWDEVPAPSCSTTVALAMGDALAFSVTRAKGLGREMFAFNHPGGKLGADFRSGALGKESTSVSTPKAEITSPPPIPRKSAKVVSQNVDEKQADLVDASRLAPETAVLA